MRVLVTGGRDFPHRSIVFEVLNSVVEDIELIIEGGAIGADTFAREWARERCVPLSTHHANWQSGPLAGRIRNELMLRKEKPDLVIAFPGGAGTAHMTTIALNAGVEVRKVRVNWEIETFKRSMEDE